MSLYVHKALNAQNMSVNGFCFLSIVTVYKRKSSDESDIFGSFMINIRVRACVCARKRAHVWMLFESVNGSPCLHKRNVSDEP